MATEPTDENAVPFHDYALDTRLPDDFGSASYQQHPGKSDIHGKPNGQIQDMTQNRDHANTASSKHTGIRSALGLQANAPISDAHDDHPHHNLWWNRVRLVMREPFAEFWGVFIMVMFGDGSVAQVLLSEKQTSAPGGMGFGSYQSISWGYVLACTIAKAQMAARVAC